MTDEKRDYKAKIRGEEPAETEYASGIPVRYAPPLPDNPIERVQRSLEAQGIPRLPPHIIDIILRAGAARQTLMGIPVEISNEIPPGMLAFKQVERPGYTFTPGEIERMKKEMQAGEPTAVPHAPQYERSPLLDALYDLALTSRGLRWRLAQEGASHALVTGHRTGAAVPDFTLRITTKDVWRYSRGQWRQMIEDMMDGKSTDVTPFMITTGSH